MLFCYEFIGLNTKYFTGLREFRNFGSMIVQERKLYESTIHVDEKEPVCENLTIEEKNNFESSNTVEDAHDDNILEAVHQKMYDILLYILM